MPYKIVCLEMCICIAQDAEIGLPINAMSRGTISIILKMPIPTKIWLAHLRSKVFLKPLYILLQINVWMAEGGVAP